MSQDNINPLGETLNHEAHQLEEQQSHVPLVFPWESEMDQTRPSDLLQRQADRVKKKYREACSTFSWLDWAQLVLPCISWLRTYKWKKWLISDIIAGISVGFMVVPQGMSYAVSAGLPAVFGLYGAFLPCITYTLFGSSNQLAVGPVAVTSLIISANLQRIIPCANSIVNPNSPPPELVACQDQYNKAAIQLAFLVSMLYTGIGIMRLGWVTKFLSHAVISGFTTGAAITIGMGQVKYLLGFTIDMGHSTRIQDYISAYVDGMDQLRWQEYIMGMTLIVVLVWFRESQRFYRPLRYIRPFGALFCCIIGISSVYIGKIETPQRGSVRIVGSIPAGLPSFTVGWWTPMTDPSFTDLIVTAIIVMIVDLLESTSIARALARKNGYELVYNREIIGLGLANLVGAAFQSYTTTGSFSRSAVNDMSGAKTPLAQAICGFIVMLVLLLLTSVFAKLPFNVLAAIVIVSVSGLFEFEQAIYLWKVNKLDLCCWLASALGCVFISIELGLGIAVGVAVLLAIYQTAFPHTAVLGRLAANAGVYRNIKQYPDAKLVPGILAFRIDAPVYFANAKTLEDKIEKAMVKYTAWSQIQGVPKLHFLIIDLTPVHHLDSMGLHFLEDMIFHTKERGIQLILANPSRNVSRDWNAVRVPELIGRENIYVSMHDAFTFAQNRLPELGVDLQQIPVHAMPLSDVRVDGSNGSASSHNGAAGGYGMRTRPHHVDANKSSVAMAAMSQHSSNTSFREP